MERQSFDAFGSSGFFFGIFATLVIVAIVGTILSIHGIDPVATIIEALKGFFCF